MQQILNWQWYDFDELGSTNDEAKELSAKLNSQPFVVTAQNQTNGRGRRGREWISLNGNLFMSLGLECQLKDLGALAFITSLAILDVIKSLNTNSDVKLKWPNDVLLNNHKVTGILMEKGEGDYIIIGVGVNIKAAPNVEGLIYPTISLADTGINVDRISFLEKYLEIFNHHLTNWKRLGFSVIKDEWLKNAKGLGEDINVHMEHCDKKGKFYGVDDNATLLLETPNGIEKIYAGDVFYIGKSK